MFANASIETTKPTNAFMHSQNRKNQMNTENIMRWNTGAHYTENGQRIAAIEVDGGVFMSDMDRGISYFFPDCPFYQSEIMRRYLYNDIRVERDLLVTNLKIIKKNLLTYFVLHANLETQC